jgi:hypothetical protein
VQVSGGQGAHREVGATGPAANHRVVIEGSAPDEEPVGPSRGMGEPARWRRRRQGSSPAYQGVCGRRGGEVERRPGKKKVHALIAKVYRRQTLEWAWEKGKQNRGRAGIAEVSMAQFATRKAYSLDRLHRKRRDGTYQPQPGKRVEIPKAEGGVRKLGIPAGLDRGCQQALVQRMEAIFEPTFRDSSCG